MMQQPAAIESTLPHQCSCQPEVLSTITNPGVNLTVWQRAGKMSITRELTRVEADSFPDGRHRTSRASFDADIAEYLTNQALDPEAFKHFRADLQEIATRFFDICGSQEIRFRLLTTDSDDCRRFHVDYRHLRLLCTYKGDGTQWLTNEQADRAAYEKGQSNEFIIRFGNPSQLEPFWVGLIKDDGYPGNKGQGLMHRSPPIAGSGQVRVLFCMDAAPAREAS